MKKECIIFVVRLQIMRILSVQVAAITKFFILTKQR